jgi:outer membrane protein assembly factor BamE (lipoprotein component of BamABCDE complex)
MVGRSREKLLVASSSIRGWVLTILMAGSLCDAMTTVKKTIDTVIADPAVASEVESKTVKLGMSTDEVKKSLGNPDKIVDLGAKQVFIYKDIKIVFIDDKV